MPKINLIFLPYAKNMTVYVNNIALSPWSIWLDSGRDNNPSKNILNTTNRFDIISSWPNKTIISNLNYTIIQDIKYDNNLFLVNKTFSRITNNQIDPIETITQILKSIQDNVCNDNTLEYPDQNIPPFWCGAMGYFSYDLNQLLNTKIKINNPSDIPLMAVGIYSWALISDHELEKTYITWDETFISKNTINYIFKLLTNPNLNHSNISHAAILQEYFTKNDFFKPHTNYKDYKNNFNTIKLNIYNGNCYQINYSIMFTGRFDSHTHTSPWEFYKYLRNLNPNPFSCYFNISHDLTVLSFSPERFLKINNNQVITQPIKGTRKNHPDANSRNTTDLITNPKDRAENVMITDLMRNDLNKYCTPGTVNTPELCKLYTFPTVHHLISTVEGHLKPGINSLNLFKGCFPGGSITGAPKIKAMEIIQDLENQNKNPHRHIYCGSIGYININNNLDMSITIRTLLHYDSTYYYWAGSGIVADSNCADEYNEIFCKLIRTH